MPALARIDGALLLANAQARSASPLLRLASQEAKAPRLNRAERDGVSTYGAALNVVARVVDPRCFASRVANRALQR